MVVDPFRRTAFRQRIADEGDVYAQFPGKDLGITEQQGLELVNQQRKYASIGQKPFQTFLVSRVWRLGREFDEIAPTSFPNPSRSSAR